MEQYLKRSLTRVLTIVTFIIISLYLLMFIRKLPTEHLLESRIDVNAKALYASRDSRNKAMEQLRASLRAQRALIEEIACKSNGIGARGGFCLNKDQVNVGGNYMWDLGLASNLERGIFKGQTIGDLGAGLGWYGRFWTRNLNPLFKYGKEVEEAHLLNRTDIRIRCKEPQLIASYKGFDGAGNVETVTGNWIAFLDLTEEQQLPQFFDWVISLEVGEHIPPQFQTTFLENLVRHACKGIVLSWAVEGQGGHYHVNNHNNDYIKAVMTKYHFRNDFEVENYLRKNVSLSHFTNTLMIFRRIRQSTHPKCTLKYFQ